MLIRVAGHRGVCAINPDAIAFAERASGDYFDDSVTIYFVSGAYRTVEGEVWRKIQDEASRRSEERSES